MIDLAQTYMVVSTYPSRSIDHRLTRFFLHHGMPFENIVAAYNKCSVVERRNRVVRYLLPKLDQFSWFVFVDQDHYPEDDEKLLLPFLEDTKEDVVGCWYDTGKASSWLTPETFHMGMVRVRNDVFRALQPPWFLFEYNEDGTSITLCECGYFGKKVLEAGFSIGRRGVIGHESEHSWRRC